MSSRRRLRASRSSATPGGIHDINEPLDGHILPAEEHVEGLLEFVRAWRPDDAPLLIHCMADRVFYGQAGRDLRRMPRIDAQGTPLGPDLTSGR
jgi:hypothetical protein